MSSINHPEIKHLLDKDRKEKYIHLRVKKDLCARYFAAAIFITTVIIALTAIWTGKKYDKIKNRISI